MCDIGIPVIAVAFTLLLLPAGVFVRAMNSIVPGEFIAPGEALFAARKVALILKQRDVSKEERLIEE